MNKCLQNFKKAFILNYGLYYIKISYDFFDMHEEILHLHNYHLYYIKKTSVLINISILISKHLSINKHHACLMLGL